MKTVRWWLLVGCVAAVLVPAVLSGQTRTINWASFPVEREKFIEAEPGRYAAVGTFDGVGMMYFSPTKKVTEFQGLRRIELPYLGQEADDKYEFRHESFTIVSVIPTGEREYAFQAINHGGPFARTVTGKVRFSLQLGWIGCCAGIIEEFLMDEHGQTLKGVMNRYRLPRSTASKAMLKKYDEVFFGGNYVALEK